MSLLVALLIGLVQGVTEFFPISSSTHIRYIKECFACTQDDVLFDLLCHLGTLGALVLYFKRDIIALLSQKRALVLLFVALLPLVLAYFLFKPLRMGAMELSSLGWTIIASACMLLVAPRWARMASAPGEEMVAPVRDVLWVGVAQALALIPGISRSAATMSCARLCGWPLSLAVRFSFLLSIPAILGGCGIELLRCRSACYPWTHYAMGFFASFIAGSVMIRMAVPLLERGRWHFFAAYCFVFALFLLLR